ASAADAPRDADRLNQTQLVLVERQFVRLVGLGERTTATFQVFKLDPHIETPWLTDSPHQGASHKVVNYSWPSGTFKTAAAKRTRLSPARGCFSLYLAGSFWLRPVGLFQLLAFFAPHRLQFRIIDDTTFIQHFDQTFHQ